jgi:GT2 family glycosyltransferase
MRASIIIAAHNEGGFLRRTVESCADSVAGLDVEIVVADDASTDGSVQELQEIFPHVRVVSHDIRKGASPSKALGARAARGDVLVFLDAHTKAERTALRQLVEDVDAVAGQAIVTPAIAPLNITTWQVEHDSLGHGYSFDLRTFACGWVDLPDLRESWHGGRRFYESPALIGCAIALARTLYERLWGFDAHMQGWGVEDLDLSLKSWLMGHPILHDPEVVVGHRFRTAFDTYAVTAEDVLVNQLRCARKNFTSTVWDQWTGLCVQRIPDTLPDHPEGLWARSWHLFHADRASAETERAYLHGNRVHDEFWYARRFGLSWPALAAEAPAAAAETLAALGPSPSPSPSPPPPCHVSAVQPVMVTVPVGVTQTFTATGAALAGVQWQATGGSPAAGTGPTFVTKWATVGAHTVIASCAGTSAQAAVTVVAAPTLEILDKGGAVASSVAVGLWDHAFNPTAGTLRNDAPDANNFVGSDSRRFQLRVTDQAARGRVQVSWRTTFDDGSNDDVPGDSTITLLETGASTGVFLSRPLMLVTDAEDKNQPTNSGLPAGDPAAGLRNPGQSNHRLRRVTVDDAHPLTSRTTATYAPAAGSPVTIVRPVFGRNPEDRRRMQVHLVNLRNAVGGTPILTAARRTLIKATIQATYARCGIFAAVGEIVLDPPAACTGWPTRFPGDVLASDPSVEGPAFSGGNLVPSASQNAVFAAVQAAAGISANHLYIAYVSHIYKTPLPGPGGHLSDQAGGVAFPDSFTPAGPARGFAFVAVASGVTQFADPHEATHNTTNLRNAAGGHFDLSLPAATAPGPIDGRNLMNRFFLPDSLGVRNPKRLWDDQFTNSNFTPPLIIPPQLTSIRASRFVAPY